MSRHLPALLVAALAVAAGCARRSAPSPSPAPASSVASGPAASAFPAVDAGVPRVGPWAQAVRDERWDEAWAMLEALPEAERTQPEVRFARARVALARGDGRSALASLEGLDAALPLLADYVARERAEAQMIAGPFDAAAEWYLARGTPASLVRAAEAFEKAKAPVRARAACDRVLSGDKRSRAQEAEARSIRLWLAPDDAAEADDARWLAIHAPDLSWGKESDTALAKLAPLKPLTSDELLARAEAFSVAGRTDDALHAIERIEKAPGRRVNTLERSRAKGDALYRGGKYGEAARVLGQCARAGGSHVAEDAFRAARALARADRDEEAIVALTDVAKEHAGTQWGDQASFLIGRLQLLHGRWREATAALDAYVAKYPNGAEHHDAARDRALARLLEGDAHGARPLFEQLAEDEADPLAAGRARTMAALAAFRDGDRTHAIARWTDVARSRPLSWPALVARARLTQIGAPLPAFVDSGDADDASAPPAAPVPLAIALPSPVDLLHRIGLDSDAENELHERESVVSAAVQGRSTEALCDAYGQLGRAKRRYQVAQQIPAALLAVAPTAKTHWSWDCAFPMPYDADVAARAKEDDLSPALVYGVMRQESGFDPDVVSPARAVGLLQLLPETAKTLVARDRTEDAMRLTSPSVNIALGSRYLKDLLARFHGVLPLAIAAYNAGPDAVARWLERPRGLDLDLFVERIPFTETRVYVARVMGNMARYGYLRGGEAGVPIVSLELNGDSRDSRDPQRGATETQPVHSPP
jgi:soluble lytic murein transglycosylase